MQYLFRWREREKAAPALRERAGREPDGQPVYTSELP